MTPLLLNSSRCHQHYRTPRRPRWGCHTLPGLFPFLAICRDSAAHARVSEVCVGVSRHTCFVSLTLSPAATGTPLVVLPGGALAFFANSLWI